MVGGSSAAEGDPIVKGALAVDDQVAHVGEGLPVAQPDLVENGRIQGLGRDHERVEGDHIPMGSSELRAVALCGPHDCLGADSPCASDDTAGADLEGGRLSRRS